MVEIPDQNPDSVAELRNFMAENDPPYKARFLRGDEEVEETIKEAKSYGNGRVELTNEDDHTVTVRTDTELMEVDV